MQLRWRAETSRDYPAQRKILISKLEDTIRIMSHVMAEPEYDPQLMGKMHIHVEIRV